MVAGFAVLFACTLLPAGRGMVPALDLEQAETLVASSPEPAVSSVFGPTPGPKVGKGPICPDFDKIARAAMENFTITKFGGVWYETFSKTLMTLGGCACTTFNVTANQTGGPWTAQFGCDIDPANEHVAHSGPTLSKTFIGSAPEEPWHPSKMMLTMPLEAPFNMLRRVTTSPFDSVMERTFAGINYWVLDVVKDKAGEYQYALVYSCLQNEPLLPLPLVKQEYIWILARQPWWKPDTKDAIDRFYALLEEKGINHIDGIRQVPHDTCAPAIMNGTNPYLLYYPKVPELELKHARVHPEPLTANR